MVRTPSAPILKGFWRTVPCICPDLMASMKAWLESNPTNGTFPAFEMSWSASSMPAADDSFGQKMPDRSLPKRFSRFSEARFAVSRVAPAYWSLEIRLMPGATARSFVMKPSSRAVVEAEPS